MPLASSRRTASAPACARAAEAAWACGGLGGGEQQEEQDWMRMLFSAAFPGVFSD